MKKLAAWFVGLLVLLCGAAALANTSIVMHVVNCKEYVSLREAPDSKSKRLKKVYLGEWVIECSEAENGYIQCTYDNNTGYIMSQYLETTAYDIFTDIMPNQMVINCSDWVSMVDSPYKGAPRVTRVPLGAIVRSCIGENSDFIFCQYKNYYGFIERTYLKKANYSAGTPSQKVIDAGRSFPALPDTMTVYNCDQWVSLREKASASATRLARVPLGARVTGCVYSGYEWVYCKYGGMWGYIQAAYLYGASSPATQVPVTIPPMTAAPVWITPTPAPSYAQRSFDSLPALPAYSDFTATGANILDVTTLSGLNVIVQYTDNDGKERIMAACYDALKNCLWSTRNESELPLVEGRLTWAMMGGTATDPQLILFVAGKGLYSYSIKPYMEVRWMLQRFMTPLMTSATTNATAMDGTVYIACDNVLYAIAPEGTVRFMARHEHQNIHWPAEIDIGVNTVTVCYDSGETDDDLYDTVTFDLEGNELYVSTRKMF